MNPAYRGELLHKPHIYVTRKRSDGTTISGYEAVPDALPTADDLDAVAAEDLVREATKPQGEKHE